MDAIKNLLNAIDMLAEDNHSENVQDIKNVAVACVNILQSQMSEQSKKSAEIKILEAKIEIYEAQLKKLKGENLYVDAEKSAKTKKAVNDGKQK